MLRDNKGRAWPPLEMLSGRIELEPGQVSGDIGPRFDGKLLTDSEVNELTLTVQSLLGIQELQWRIPINVQPSPSQNDTLRGSELPVGQVWYYGGLEFKLERIEISANDINTKFYITNNTTIPFIFEPRFDSGFFELKDNLGRIWQPTTGTTDRIALNPGDTSGDIGPRFDGTWLVDQNVQSLGLTVRGLLGVPEAKWVFEVNKLPQNPTRLDTSPGTMLTIGEPWWFSDLVLRLDRVEIGQSDINTKFYVSNYTQSIFVFEYGPNLGYFLMIDNKGRTWSVTSTPEGRTVLFPEQSSGDIGPRFDGTYLSDPEVSYVVLIVKGLFGFEDAMWKIDITH